MITAHGNESLAAAALRLGADDYLAKDQSLLELLQIGERRGVAYVDITGISRERKELVAGDGLHPSAEQYALWAKAAAPVAASSSPHRDRSSR